MAVCFAGIVIAFFVMTMLPFLLSLGVPRDVEGTLVVRSDNKRDPRYFAKSFRGIMEKAFAESGKDGLLHLSKDEPYILGEELGKHVKSGRVDSLVISPRNFETAEALTFEKEIYVRGEAKIASGSVLRAISAQNVTLGVNCRIYRWSDAEEKMAVFPGAKLGSSCTSRHYLAISEGCSFLKLYAPTVEVMNRTRVAEAREPAAEPEEFLVLPIMEDVVINWKKVDADDTAGHSIVTAYRLLVGNRAVVMGHIKSKKGVHLGRDVIVYGNIFAEKAIVMEEGCRIYGNVFSQDSVYVGPGCTIGRVGRTKSIIGRQGVILSEGAVAYGYVGCEHKGCTVETGRFKKMIQKAKEA